MNWLFTFNLENFTDGNSRKSQWKPHKRCNLVFWGRFNSELKSIILTQIDKWLLDTNSLLLITFGRLSILGWSELVKRAIPSHTPVTRNQNNTFMTSIYQKQLSQVSIRDGIRSLHGSTKYEMSIPNQKMCRFNMFVAAVCFLFLIIKVNKLFFFRCGSF